MKSKFIITIDVDWISDEIMEYASDIFRKHEIKSTWFITHDSAQTRRLMKDKDIFEVAIHPNFLPNSTHGKSRCEVMDHLLNIYPAARIMRTHSLYQSTPLFGFIQENYPQIKLDVSMLMPHIRGAQVSRCCFSERFRNRLLYRVPYLWEDDFEMMMPDTKFKFSTKNFSKDGMNILNFHPIHIVLNSRDMKRYRALKDRYGLSNLKLRDTVKFRNDKHDGVETFLRAILTKKDIDFFHFRDWIKL